MRRRSGAPHESNGEEHVRFDLYLFDGPKLTEKSIHVRYEWPEGVMRAVDIIGVRHPCFLMPLLTLRQRFVWEDGYSEGAGKHFLFV